ncbi:MAG TPA: hypothetical protein VGP94_03815 [Tepidisphaeraceae bacterium]|jgi:hypothetical protein|nr:hypothetical protein [Tepidisphaeraceae bacterium]
MKLFLLLLMVALLSVTAEAQNRRDRSRDRGPDRSSDRSSSNSSSGSAVPDDNADKSSFDHYKVLSDHNIFTKNRRPPTSRPTRDGNSDRPPPKPEVAFILTGCSIQDDNKYAAFVENAQTGVTLKVSPGDPIATGKVTAIGFDFLEYETGGQKTKVEIGHNFTGSVASLAEVIAAPSTTGPTTGPVDLSNLSIEERLKRRRLLETGGK